VAVGVAAQHLDAPAVDLVTGIEQLRSFDQCTAAISRSDSRSIPSIVSPGMPCDDQYATNRSDRDGPTRRRTGRSPHVPGAPARRSAPGCHGSADVVGMHVRDDDLLDRCVQLVSTGRQFASGSREPSPVSTRIQPPLVERSR